MAGGIAHRDDGALLAASVARPELFVELYDRRARDVLAYFARRTFDAQAAVDLTAETFAAAADLAPRFAGRGDEAGANEGELKASWKKLRGAATARP